jgi:hypothetical protein
VSGYKLMVLSAQQAEGPVQFFAFELPGDLKRASFQFPAESAQVIARLYRDDVRGAFLADSAGQLRPKSTSSSTCAEPLPAGDEVLEADLEHDQWTTTWRSIDSDPLAKTAFLIPCKTTCDDRYRITVRPITLDTTYYTASAVPLDATSGFVSTVDGRLYRISRDGTVELLSPTSGDTCMCGAFGGYAASDGTVYIAPYPLDLQVRRLQSFHWPSIEPVQFHPGVLPASASAIHGMDGSGGGSSLELYGASAIGDLVMLAPTSTVVVPSRRNANVGGLVLWQSPGRVILSDLSRTVVRYTRSSGTKEVAIIGDSSELVTGLCRSWFSDHLFFVTQVNISNSGGSLVETDAELNPLLRISYTSYVEKAFSVQALGGGVFLGGNSNGVYWDVELGSRDPQHPELGFCSPTLFQIPNAAMRSIAAISPNDLLVTTDQTAGPHAPAQLFWVTLEHQHR